MSSNTSVSTSLSSFFSNQSSLAQDHEDERETALGQRMAHVTQEIFQSPLTYYGSRGIDQNDFFQLIQSRTKEKGRFRCFYDLFTGSGASSLYAMSLKIADSYRMNDLFAPLKVFWESIKKNPEELILNYCMYLFDYLNAQDRNVYFSHLKKLYNQSEQGNSALFAFIINHSESGKPILSKVGEGYALVSKLIDQVGELPIDKVFAVRVREVSQLFKINNVVFSAQDFNTFIGTMNEEDFVMMDPPNPHLPDEIEAPHEHAYQRSVSKSILTDQLRETIKLLNQRNVAFLMFYGILGRDSPSQLKYPAGHIYRLSGRSDNKYTEHAYLSDSLIPHLFNGDLPDTIQPCFYRIFESQALINGDKQALSWSDSGTQKFLSYRELNQISNKLARKYRFEKGSLVAIYLERTPALIISMLAVMKSGATYMPFDENADTLSRDACLQNMEQSQVKYLLTTPAILKELQNIKDSHSILDSMTIIPLKDPLCKEATQTISESSNLDLPIHRDDLAYVMNTSGSTGRPKGVMISHKGLPYAFSSHQNLLNIQTSDRIAQFGSVGFDASLMEIMIALGSGATLYLMTNDIYTDEKSLTSYLANKKISIVIQTPAMLAELDPSKLPNMRKIFIVGDKFTETLSNHWIRTTGELVIERQVFNGYGLTETTICTTLEECSLNKKLSIGKEILGLKIYLRDKKEEVDQKVELANAKWLNPPQNDQDPKVEGVIYVAGICLSQGYWQRPDLTEKAFKKIQINFQDTLLYNTGDVAYYQADGSLVVIGRIGRQLKIRGQRIELDQVEQIVIEMKELVSDVRAIAKQSVSNQYGSLENHLALYLVPRNPDWVIEDRQASEESLKQLIVIRNYIRAKTHSSMVPALNCMKFIREITYKDNDKKSCDDALLQAMNLPCIDVSAEKEADLIGLSQHVRELLGWIRNVLGDVLKINPETISFSEHTMDELGADSLKILRCIRALDQRADEKPQFKEAIKSITASILRRSTLYQLGSYLQKNMQEINAAQEQKTREEKTYGIATQKRVLTSVFNLGEESFFNKISIPFYVVHSLLGDAETDYGASVIKKLSCTYENLDTPSVELMNSWEKEKFIDRLADHHIAEMKKKEGPLQKIFWLLGWSSGGLVALKIAKKLRSEGKKVYLFLLDPTHPQAIQGMSHEKHTEMLIKVGDKLLSVAAHHAEYFGELKVDCKKNLEALQSHQEQASFLFTHVFHKIEVLKMDQQAHVAIDKMIVSAKMIYESELSLQEEFILLVKYDKLFFAKTSDARVGWTINPTLQAVAIEGDHFQIVNSDLLKNEINKALHKQFKESVDEVSVGMVNLNLGNSKEAAECFKRAVNKNPGDMRAQQMYIQSKLLLNEYTTVSDHVSKLLSEIDRAETCTLMTFRKTLKAYECIAKHLLRDANTVSKAMHLSQSDITGMNFDDIEAISSDQNNLGNAKKVQGSFDELLGLSRVGKSLTLHNDNELSILGDYYKFELIDFLKEEYFGTEPLQFSSILGTNALIIDNYDQAIKHFTKAITKQPPSPFAYAGRACAYYFSGKKQSALRDLNTGISMFPKHFALRAIRGTSFYLSNQYVAAQLDLKMAVVLKPKNDFIINHLIHSYRKTNLVEALHWAQYYIDNVRDDIKLGYLAKGTIYLDMHELDRAEEALTKGISVDPKAAFSLYLQRAEIHYQRKNAKEVIKDATEALKLEPYRYEALIMRVNGYMLMGQFEECINDLNLCIAHNPTNTIAKATLIGLQQNIQLIKNGKMSSETLIKIFEKQFLHPSSRASSSEDGLIHLQTMDKLYKGMENNPEMPELLSEVACSTPLSKFMLKEAMNDQELRKQVKREYRSFSSLSNHSTSNRETVSSFEKSFTILPTEADGACALHALLGTNINKRLFLEAARTKYVEAFNQHFSRVELHWENCMLDKFKEYLGPEGGSSFVKLIFDQVPDVIRLLRNVLDSLVGEQREALLKSYIQFPLFKDIYLNACLNPSYYFAIFELGIAAQLLNKKVHIYSQTVNGVMGPIEYGQGHETIVIYHQDNHYSRCEPKLGGS